MKAKRKSGWYWVRESVERAWRVAEWSSLGWWYVCGYDGEVDSFNIIGPRINPPREARRAKN